jgi:hypothetical protein
MSQGGNGAAYFPQGRVSVCVKSTDHMRSQVTIYQEVQKAKAGPLMELERYLPQVLDSRLEIDVLLAQEISIDSPGDYVGATIEAVSCLRLTTLQIRQVIKSKDDASQLWTPYQVKWGNGFAGDRRFLIGSTEFKVKTEFQTV